MDNNLLKVEKNLRSLAKRYKTVKYSIGLAILFLMMGVNAFSEDVMTKQEIKSTASKLQEKLDELKKQNEKGLSGAKLELIQLMEQLDQVVKSPWTSWQVGANFFIGEEVSNHKRKGDKKEAYSYEGIYRRGNWVSRYAKDGAASLNANGNPLTPGNESLEHWRRLSSTNNVSTIKKDKAIDSSTNGKREWGRVQIRKAEVPTSEVEILARVSPKEITKQPIPLDVKEPSVAELQAPKVEPDINTPLTPPEIVYPTVEDVVVNKLTIETPDALTAPASIDVPINISAPNTPTAPAEPNAPSTFSLTVTPNTPSVPNTLPITINIPTPEITPLSITAPEPLGTVNVTTSTVTPVEFSLSPRGLSSVGERYFVTSSTYTWNDKSVEVDQIGSYISLWDRVYGQDGINTTMTVNAEDTRAFMVDEGLDYKDNDGLYKPFRFIGKIDLNKAKNVGIDVQGTHSGPKNVPVINEGLIVGNFTAPDVKNQVGFGFNNFDASSSYTRTEMINRKRTSGESASNFIPELEDSGVITLNAPESVGFQLRPENPANGLSAVNMMAGENYGDININGYGSFAFSTVKNAYSTSPSNNTGTKVHITAGGQIASSAFSVNGKSYESYMKNEGNININSDDSIGIGLMHNIQGVYAGGNINVGTKDPNTFKDSTGKDIAAPNKNISGYLSTKVDGAVGIYSEVITRPVRAGDFDDNANKNTTGKTIGTETVEASGTVTLGEFAAGSSGLRIKDKGSITLKNGGKVLVGGEKNYGAVVEGKDYQYYRKTEANKYAEDGIAYNDTGKINLEAGAEIKATGKEAIGYVMKYGKGENAGTISVVGHDDNKSTASAFNGSLGYYGEKGSFTNANGGKIVASGNIAHAVALVGDPTDGTTFENKGTIEVNDKENIGVYGSGNYTFNHKAGLIKVGADATGIYAKDATGTLNINAPIELADSSTNGTTIGAYSDGNAKFVFGTDSKIKTGKKTVGLYTGKTNVENFANTYKIKSGEQLEVDLAENSTLALLEGDNTKNINLSALLNSNSLNITNFSKGASIFYATGGVKAHIDGDYTMTNPASGMAESTAVVVAADGSTADVLAGKTLTVASNVGLIATTDVNKTPTPATATAINSGKIVTIRDNGGIGIYTNESHGRNDATGEIETKKHNSVGLFGEKNSDLVNDGKITTKEVSSAGVYASDSSAVNNGADPKGIIVENSSSAGIYALLKGADDKNIDNAGDILLNDNTKEGSAGVYSKVESTSNKLTTKNLKKITVEQQKSAGIYAENSSSQANTQSEVSNPGLIKVLGEKSVGIVGEKSVIKNSGTATNGIELKAKSSAGMVGKLETVVTNEGRIETSGVSPQNSQEGLVGISVDETSTATNATAGTIVLNTDYSSAMSGKGSDGTNAVIENKGTITLNNQATVGMSSINGKATNDKSAEIKVKNSKSVGIYANLKDTSTGNQDQVENKGTITLEDDTKSESAGMYSKLESTSKKLSMKNSATISVGQKNSAGMYASNISTQDATKSEAINDSKVQVTVENSAAMIGEKSTLTNTNNGNGLVLSAKKTVGIIGNKKSVAVNDGKITMQTATSTKAEEGLIGISLNDSEATNSSTGFIKLGTAYSTGMFGENASVLTNEGKIVGDKDYSVGMAGTGSATKLTNDKEISLDGKNSTGLFAKDKAEAINNKIININGEKSVGIVSENATVTNANGATLKLIEKGAVGIFGRRKATITNSGKIETTTVTISKADDGLVGIFADDSTATNDTTGVITLGTAYSTGMFGENASKVENKGSITGEKDHSVGMAGSGSGTKITNKNIITLNDRNSTGIFGEDSAELLNDTDGTITTKEEASVGIYSKSNATATAKNAGTIVTEKKTSAGMLGDEGEIENTNSITTKEEKSAGMYGKNSNATNKKNIVTEKKTSAGMLIVLDGKDKQITGTNENPDGLITIKDEASAGMLGKITNLTGPTANSSLTLNNKSNINVETKKSVAMMLKNESTVVTKDKITAENNGEINLVAGTNNEENIGIYASANATGLNKKNINIQSNKSVGMLAKGASVVKNEEADGFVNLVGEESIGMMANDKSSEAINNNSIELTATAKKSIGMLAKEEGKITNNKSIKVLAEKGVGIFVSDTGKGNNSSTGVIDLESNEAVGIFAKNNGDGYTAINEGTINLGKADKTTNTKFMIGMFAHADGSEKASVKNTKDINVNTIESAGMFAKNDTTDITNVDLLNEGTINVSNRGSAGIYANKAQISKVGKVNLENSELTNGSSAVYLAEGGKVLDTANSQINLGTINQNRVAYYLNGKDASLGGADIGKIDGYGVGLYLQGNSNSDKAKIDTTTPILDYTLKGSGDGIIGLLLKNETDISAYDKKIKVGKSIDKNPALSSDKDKYAIGIYTDGQGSAGNSYEINTAIETAEKGVGIFVANDSKIKYKGTMEIGANGVSGTGVYIKSGELNLDNNAKIKLKGNSGVGIIATEGTKFAANNATIEMNGNGIGVYAKRGSEVHIANWKFNNNGNRAEEIRSEEGGVYFDGNKELKPGVVSAHVINGETIIANGVTVKSVADGSITPKENIALMAEGNKNPNITTVVPSLTWRDPDFEIVNNGTIDFSAAENSTAIYAVSARVKNNGEIKVAKNSTAIYGIYKADTQKYDGTTANKFNVETTDSSKITLGGGSTGVYLVNAEAIPNFKGEIKADAGATKNVGVYVINGNSPVSADNKILTLTNTSTIELGDGSVGIYSKGKSNTERNIITSSGNIKVGKRLDDDHQAVAIYGENTNIESTGNITVGEYGIAFYGKNSEVTARGTANIQDKGVLGYFENSKFTSYLGNLSGQYSTLLYLKNSIAKLDGNGAKVDVDVADNHTGIYAEGNSKIEGLKTLKLGENSRGIFLKDANITTDVESIESDKKFAKAIVAKNSSLTSAGKIILSGDDSVGIYSNSNNANNKIINSGELTLSGKRTLGVILKGSQTFENNATINILDSTDIKEPTIGIYTIAGSSNIKHNGLMEVGNKSVGIYSTTNSDVEIASGKIHVKDQGIGIYKENGKVKLNGKMIIDSHAGTEKNTEPVGVYAVNGAEIIDKANEINIGEKSYGFILSNTDPNKITKYSNTNTGNITMGNDSVFLYSKGKAKITNNRNLVSNGDKLIGFYIKDSGEFTNNADIDFSTGKGSIGIYTSGEGAKAINKKKIFVAKTDDIDPATNQVYTDTSKIVYGIGMAAENGSHIVNDGEIRIFGNKSIGMYGKGIGTVVENTKNGNILLDGSRATDSNKIQTMTGVYVDYGATFKNYGNIRTTEAYAGRDGKVNQNVSGLVGVAVMNGSTLENHGNIEIDGDSSYGLVIRGERATDGTVERYATIKNYGNIKVRGKSSIAISWKDITEADRKALEDQINTKLSSDPKGNELRLAGGGGTDLSYENINIAVKDGKAVFTRNGKPVSDVEVEKIEKLLGTQPNLSISDIGYYVDTLGRTKPIEFEGVTPGVDTQLIIGTEYSKVSNKKQWLVTGEVLKPFLDQIQGKNLKLTTRAASYTWMATPVLDNNGQMTGVAMSQIDYNLLVEKKSNAYNFAAGLQEIRERNMSENEPSKVLISKLEAIGANEPVLWSQAIDEMMGHQYANVQQRVYQTGSILDKEFNYLRKDWQNFTKDSNKIKTFGTRGEYKTSTSGLINYTNSAYGVAYVHEDETLNLGKSSGWYTGIVENRFKFKDIGNSKEDQLQGKIGVFKSIPFDYDNSLNWTVSGDISLGYNRMNRRFLVVDEIFNAKAKYFTYGVSIKNELSKEFRLSEDFKLRPYGNLKFEYGRINSIREKSGAVRLEVKARDYYSIKPEIGTELEFKHQFNNKTFKATLGLAYENELGRVMNVRNQAKILDTSADYFNIKSEKEDRHGNIKTDLKIGIDNSKLGITANVGYDTKTKNVRGGLGLRVIF